MEIKESLEQLGFSEKEAEIYLTILKLGKCTPSQVSRALKIPRPTVYSIARTLVSKGVIAEDLADTNLHLTPLPFDNLNVVIEKSRADLKKKEDLIGSVISDLKVFTSDKIYPIPKIRFIADNEIEDFLYQNFPRWHKNVMKGDGAWYGFQDPSFVEHYQKWIEWTAENFKTNGFVVKLFSNMTNTEKKLRGKIPTRDIRFLRNTDFTSTTWISGEDIIMIYTRKKPFYLVELHDKAMAHNMKEVFKKMWSTTMGEE